jgi:hypothetical protein
MAQELPRIVYDSALDYAKLVRRAFAVAGVPQPVGTGYHPTGEQDISTEAARRLQNELREIEKKLRGISRAGLNGLRSLAVDEREALSEEEASLVLLELTASS